MKKLMLSLVVLAMSAATAFAQCPTQGKKCDAPKACHVFAAAVIQLRHVLGLRCENRCRQR